jgi:predicted nucleic-acid-binding Zn-ribbon protein
MADSPQLTCPLCGSQDFQREEERSEGRWGFTTHVSILMICINCRYVLQFYDGRSIFDFD